MISQLAIVHTVVLGNMIPALYQVKDALLFSAILPYTQSYCARQVEA